MNDDILDQKSPLDTKLRQNKQNGTIEEVSDRVNANTFVVDGGKIAANNSDRPFSYGA